jgi:mRNA interferase HicA
MKRIDLIRKLKNAGYRSDRNGDHEIFEKQGCRSVQIPNHREINENTARQILKIAGITK